MNNTMIRLGASVPFHLYVEIWICEYPQLDVYYHMHYIEQAYSELYL